jgi:hypothetical protein
MLVRLEMDAERMSIPSFYPFPVWAVLLGLAAHFGVGFGIGILYFRSLRWSTRRFGGSMAAIIALMIGRFTLIGGVLTLASLEGALPLLTMALGVLVSRFAVIKGVREAAP